jgi:hypothetical protein
VEIRVPTSPGVSRWAVRSLAVRIDSHSRATRWRSALAIAVRADSSMAKRQISSRVRRASVARLQFASRIRAADWRGDREEDWGSVTLVSKRVVEERMGAARNPSSRQHILLLASDYSIATTCRFASHLLMSTMHATISFCRRHFGEVGTAEF